MSIYERFGITPVINASGSVTRLGGAPMPESVLQAFVAAAGEAASLEQVQGAASRRIAEVTGAEAGLVTAGSAAALQLGAAAILAGNNLGIMERLPQCEGHPHEFVVAREQRNGYDHAVRAAGVRLVEVGYNEITANAGVRLAEPWEYEAAFGPQTAGVLYGFSKHSLPFLRQVVERAHRNGLPVLVDAAGELPPRSNLKEIVATGADLVAFSGGKAIRGPQSTGILCGRRDLIASAAVQMLDMDDHFELWNPPVDFINKDYFGGIPRHGIGRALKVSKEEIIALLAALELFVSGTYDADLAKFRTYLETISRAIEGRPATTTITASTDQHPPVLSIQLDEAQLGRSAFEVCRSLREGTPPIYVGHGRLRERRLEINPLCLNPERAAAIARRLAEELKPAGTGGRLEI